MPTNSKEKIGVILLSMGGPDSIEDITSFLFNIFSDRAIIRLPGGALFQKPFAWMISRLRTKKVQDHYTLIGGKSPLVKWTEAQGRLIERQLKKESIEVHCYAGMRYFRPMTENAIKQAHADGCRRILFLPMYPQYSTATTGSSFLVARDTLRALPGVSATFISDFHDNPDYAGLMGEYIEKNIAKNDVLLFSAHSLPQKFVDEGDPYVDQVKKTAALAAGERPYFISFQSRSGPVTWVGPDTIDETKRLLNETSGGIFVVPISFVCDHIETLYEIDIELPQLMGESGSKRIRRMPMFNDDPRFAEVLAGIIKQNLISHE
ncbi:MAG: ferrochelatase [Candidatus Zixiibacteriota bacterium]